MDGSSRRSWRKGSRTPRAAGGGHGEAGRSSWQTRRSDSAPGPLSSRRVRLFLLALVALVLIVGFVYFVFFVPIRTPLLAVAITQYPAPLPPNAYAQETVNHFAAANPTNVAGWLLRDGRTRDDCRKFLEGQLSARGPGGPQRDVVLLYLSAHGAVNEQNQPCLLFGDAKPLDSTTWLPVSELLEWLQQEQERTSKPRKLVLLLDAGQLQEEWGLGILYNGFAELLADAVQRAAVPRLFVVNAASAGQVAWPAPELNGTVFGHFVARALAGAARGRDNQVTLLELCDYLQAQVPQWTVTHRDDVQTPRLIPDVGPEQDFPLVFAGGAAADEGFGADDTAARQEQVARRFVLTNALWKQYEQRWAEQPVLRHDPLGLAAVQHKLLRAEQLALAGAAYDAEFESTRAQLDGALHALGTSRLPEPITVASLPLARQIGGLPETDQELERVVAAWKAAGGRPKAKPDQPPPPAPRSHAGAAAAGLRWLTQRPALRRQELQETLGLMDEFPAAGRPGASSGSGAELVETQFLRLLEQHADWDVGGTLDERLRTGIGTGVRLQVYAERAAAPDDVRAHYWVQPLVDDADAKRRTAQDWLFVGDAAALDRAAAGARDATSAYAAAVERGTRVSDALELRDRLWSELPYLARWSLGRWQRGDDGPTAVPPGKGEPREGAPQRDKTLEAVLSRLIRGAHDFNARLDSGLTKGEPWPPAGLSEIQQQVAAGLGEFRQRYQDHCERLKSAADDRPTLRNVLAALQTPLLAADRRQALTDKLGRIMFLEGGTADAARAGSATVGPDAAGVLGAGRNADHLQWLAGLARHPAVDLLDRSPLTLLPETYRHAVLSRRPADEEQPLPWLARQGGEVRRLQDDLRGALRELEDESNRRLKESAETPANTRAGLSEADHLARAAAPLWTARTWENPEQDTAPKDDRREQDPARRLTSLDRHWQLVWHARRMLGDCWGAAKPGAATPYFAAAAGSYLAAARQLEPTPRSLRYGGDDLEQTLTRRQAALRMRPLQVQDATVLGGERTVRHQAEVRWPPDLPGGVAAVFLHTPPDAGGRPRSVTVQDQQTGRPVRRYAWEVGDAAPAGSTAFSQRQYQLPIDGLTGGRAFASLLYRGHLWDEGFTIHEPRYLVRTEVVPPQRTTAKVTVLGRGKRTAHILFVFDCSGSMSKQNAQTARRRIDTARESLETLLQAMLAESKLAGSRYEVALRAYGHRARFTKGAPYCEKEPQDSPIHPDLDAERLVPMGRLGPEQYTLLQEKLRPLQPWGQTPLYYSLRLAFDENDFQGIPPDDPKHIMVITDGANFQTECLTTQQVGTPTRPDDVLRAREAAANGQYRHTQIDIVGLDMDDPSQELRKLAEATGGRYYDAANDVQSLVARLREVIRRLEYSVYDAAADSPPPERKLLGEPWHLTNLPPRPTKFLARLYGASRLPNPQELWLEGGEAVELEYRDRDNLLVFPPYDPRSFDPRDDKRGPEHVLKAPPSGQPGPGGNRDGQRGAEDASKAPRGGSLCRVQAMLPRRVGKDVEFYVYVQQRAEAEFTRRPAHVWAEIRPAVGEDRVHVFYDPDFVPDRPVPVFRFVAIDWPATATKAEIKLWFQFDAAAVKPDAQETVNPVQPAQFQVSQLPGYAFDLRTESLGDQGYRVVVRERQAASDPVTRARVTVQPPPARITHRFYGGVQAAQHEFDYLRQTPATVQVTARAQITDAAVAVPPLVVLVPE